MNLDRLRWGEWIAAIAAVDLVLVTFRAWYKVSGGGGRVTAWDALEQGRYLLIATAIVGIFLLLLKAAEDTQQLSFPPGWLAAAVGFACTIYVAYRLASPPADTLDPDIGLFLGLVSALGVTIGGLLSAREAEPLLSEYSSTTSTSASGDSAGGPAGAEPFAPAATTEPWSPAAPQASSTGWSPAAPAAPAVPPATAAGAGGGEQLVRPGDSVVLTAGGARFPAGTVAEVVEAFAGGALVEVRAADGMAERFEVPESAYEPAIAGGAGTASAARPGEAWSPAMPAAAPDDWGFDESAGAQAYERTATGTEQRAAGDEPKPAKVPWWKREIGGGKKKGDDRSKLGTAGAAAAGAAAAAAATNGSREEKPGFFKRLFGGGGGSKNEPATETLEAETTPATGMAGIGEAAESDTAVDEGAAESAVDDPPSAAAPVAEPEADVRPGPGPEIAAAPEAAAPASQPASEPEPAASAAASEPEPPPAAADPEPPAAPEPEPIASEETPAPTEPEPSSPEPEPTASAPEVAPAEPEPAAPSAAAEGALGGAAAAGAAEETQPERTRSSGSRTVPEEALAAADTGQPKVGDEVRLKVGGGRFGAGTKGTVVDVFSAGVIVELGDDEGRTERLDLPFEAVGPADA